MSSSLPDQPPSAEAIAKSRALREETVAKMRAEREASDRRMAQALRDHIEAGSETVREVPATDAMSDREDGL